jgi:hypothetical protein
VSKILFIGKNQRRKYQDGERWKVSRKGDLEFLVEAKE